MVALRDRQSSRVSASIKVAARQRVNLSGKARGGEA